MFYHDQFIKHHQDSKQTWQIIKTILKVKKPDTLINSITSNGVEITDGLQISEKFNSYFTGVAQELVDKIPLPVHHLMPTLNPLVATPL